jgi:RNA polymerase sigma factor (sigma-70 family)
MNAHATDTTNTETEDARNRAERSDLLSRYMRDVEQRKRLNPDEETAVARAIVAQREEIADLLRAVLLKACDTLALDAAPTGKGRTNGRKVAVRPAARPMDAYLAELPKLRAETDDDPPKRNGSLRTSIARLVDKVRLSGLELKIATVATLARRKARQCERTVAASFGVPAADICRVAAAVEQKRRSIRQATQQLVESNLRLVVHVAQRSQRRGADVADLIQEGNLALLKAVDTFDPDRGVPFGAFAAISVRHAIQCSAATATDVVRVPEAVRLRRGVVRRTAAYLSCKEDGAPDVDAIAEFLELDRNSVVEAFRDGGAPTSLDTPADDDAPDVTDVADTGAIDAADALSAIEDRRLVCDRIAELDERKRRIIETRYGIGGQEQSSLAEIGRDLGVTRERARQLQERALRDLRTHETTSGSEPRRTRACLRRRLSRVARAK